MAGTDIDIRPLVGDATDTNGTAPAGDGACRCSENDAVELARLAETVLRHSYADLSALAEADPGIVDRWIAAFAHYKAKAEADARLWSAALASLSTASSPALRGSPKATA